MDITTFAQLISSVGFPIAACCFMFFQNSKLTESLTDLSNTLTKIDMRLERLERGEKNDNS